MHIADVLARDATSLSFEFFPPKTDAGWESLYRSIAEFEPLAPSFVSVTYGAGGSTRDNTHALVVRLRRETRLEAIRRRVRASCRSATSATRPTSSASSRRKASASA